MHFIGYKIWQLKLILSIIIKCTMHVLNVANGIPLIQRYGSYIQYFANFKLAIPQLLPIALYAAGTPQYVISPIQFKDL
jgi:hypothetical protein